MPPAQLVKRQYVFSNTCSLLRCIRHLSCMLLPAAVLVLLVIGTEPILVAAAAAAAAGRRLAQKDKCAGLTTAACDTGAKKGWGCCNTGTACATCALRPKMKQTVATCSSGCSYACSPKWGDCNGDLNTPDASDGCEVSMPRDAVAAAAAAQYTAHHMLC
jgi:hypothetical protein